MSLLLDKVKVQTENQFSPIFLTEFSGIITLKEPMLMADGDYYHGVFCTNWKVHALNSQITPGLSGTGGTRPTEEGQQKQIINDTQQNYSLVGFYEDQPQVVIPGNALRGLTVASRLVTPAQEKRFFDVDDWGITQEP